MNRYKLIFLLLIITSHCFSQKLNGKRIALVIGVQSYTSVPPLKNSLKDARDLSAELKKRGFQVIESYDPKGKKEMQASIRAYFDKIQNDPGIEGLFYYSGHAMQVDGINYLMPTNSNPALKADLDDQCLKMDYVLEVFAQAGNSLNIIIMDACRNNPFRGFSRSADQGLSQIYPPKGSYLVYATSPGSVASDGDGSNGLFTSKLLKYIKEPDLNLEQMFKLVAREVQKESGDRQLPWINSSYTGDFYFNSKSPANEPAIVKEQIKPPISKADSRNFVSTASILKSIKIDNKEWLSENLDVTHYRNGDEIPEVQDPKEWSRLTTGAWCYYENKVENGAKYGKLYNWYAVNDPRGLAPVGFRIPTEQEWKKLEEFLSSEPGKKLKGTSGWFDNGNGTNEYGFNAQASGFRYGTGIFSLLGKSGYWWTSTESNPQSIKVKTISFRGFGLSDALLSATSGISVRCVKD